MGYPHLTGILVFLEENVWMKQVLVVIIYSVLAKIGDFVINRGLRRLATLTKGGFDDKIVDCVHRPIYWTVFCVGVLHALLFSTLPVPWQTVIPAFIKTLILIVWIFALNKVINRLHWDDFSSPLIRSKGSSDLFNLARKILRIALFIFGGLWGLALWKVNLTPLFASAGIAGIAIALAVKDTLANFFGGISMFMDKTYKEGDYIVLDSGERGEVVDIGMRSTRIKTRDDVLITVPNSILANTKIINESAPEPRFRIRIPVGVAYGSDIDKVEEVLLGVARANVEVVENPSARVRFRALGNSSLDFELLCWIREPSLKGFVIHNILKQIYHAFGKEEITIPFQQMDVHMFDKRNLNGPVKSTQMS